MVNIDKDRYLMEASRENRSTKSHPFQYHRRNAYTDGLKFSSPTPLTAKDNCNLEWAYNRSCLCGDSWWIYVEDIVTRVGVGTWPGGLSLRTAFK